MPRGSDADRSTAGSARLWSLLDLITPMALRVAATLRVADHLAGGPTGLERLASCVGADEIALGRLLRHLVAHGVFAEPARGTFALNEDAELLVDDHPSALRRWVDLDGFGGRMDLAFFDLLAIVRAGRPPEDGHAYLDDPAIRRSYDDVMEAQSRGQAPGVVGSCDWSDAGHVVDVGGGTGTLLAAILTANPGVRGTLVELPAVAEAARRTLRDAGLADRADIVAASIFDELPEGADVYVLKFVLHSLDDPDAVEALRRCAAAVAPGGRILVIERSLFPGDDATGFTSMDLRMLILGGGRERTIGEFEALGAEAGLTLGSARATPAGPHLLEFSVR